MNKHLFARKAEDLDVHKIRWQKVPGPGWPEVADFWTYHVKVNRAIPGSDTSISYTVSAATPCGRM